MSTKWNNAQRLQKTPAVCRVEITSPNIVRLGFSHYPLQAYASWKDPYSPLDAKITGAACLNADPATNTHAGTIQGDPHSLDLLLHWNPVSGIFTYTINLKLATTTLGARSRQFATPAPELPFAAGLFTWKNPYSATHVESKLFS